MERDTHKHIELQKLRHLLQLKENDFDFLDKLNTKELIDLRLKIVEIAQFTQTDIWKRLTGVAKFFPNYMNAKISETVMGPLIAANMSYYMPEKDAIAIMKYMSVSFLALVSEYMIPEKAKHLINQIPMDILKKVTTELINNKKYVTAAGFVDVSHIPRLIELAKVIYKEEDLIRISMYVENKSYIAKIVTGFTDERIKDIITMAYDLHLQEEVLLVFAHLTNKESNRVLQIVEQMPSILKTKIVKDFEIYLKK